MRVPFGSGSRGAAVENGERTTAPAVRRVASVAWFVVAGGAWFVVARAPALRLTPSGWELTGAMDKELGSRRVMTAEMIGIRPENPGTAFQRTEILRDGG
jgi:hypothetical protein